MSEEQNEPLARIIKDCSEAGIPFPQNLVTQFERVANKLNESWGRSATADYLQDLILPSRPGRRGFPPEVAQEIMVLKSLHEERYATLIHPIRDTSGEAYNDPTRGTHSEQTDAINAALRKENLPKQPSIYGIRATKSPKAVSEPGTSVEQLIPQSVRDQLTQIRASRTSDGPATRVPAPAARADEMLLDAERLLEEEHINSGTALLEVITRLYPGHSPYAHVRLMEIYYRLRRREQYDRVYQRMTEHYECEKIEWNATNDVFVTKVDGIVQTLLLAK